MSNQTSRAVLTMWRRFIVVALLLLLAGCKSVSLVQEVTQRRATQIVAALGTHGISATAVKESGSGAKYRVEVRSENYSQSISILNDKGLLEETRESFQDLTAPQGFLPASHDMEALRMDHALAAELAELLEQNPSVESARVLVRMNYLKSGIDPAASIVILARAGQTVDQQVLTQIALQALPGMKQSNLSLSINSSAADDKAPNAVGAVNLKGRVIYVPLVPFMLGWRVPEDDYTGLAVTMLTCFLITLLIGGVVGFLYGSFFHARRAPGADAGEASSRALKNERPRKDLLDF